MPRASPWTSAASRAAGQCWTRRSPRPSRALSRSTTRSPAPPRPSPNRATAPSTWPPRTATAGHQQSPSDDQRSSSAAEGRFTPRGTRFRASRGEQVAQRGAESVHLGLRVLEGQRGAHCALQPEPAQRRLAHRPRPRSGVCRGRLGDRLRRNRRSGSLLTTSRTSRRTGACRAAPLAASR